MRAVEKERAREREREAEIQRQLIKSRAVTNRIFSPNRPLFLHARLIFHVIFLLKINWQCILSFKIKTLKLNLFYFFTEE